MPDLGAYRCSKCDINYPRGVGFRVCPNCDTHIAYFANAMADEDWRKRIEHKRSGMPMPSRQDDEHEPEPVRRPTMPAEWGHPESDVATVIYRADRDEVIIMEKELRSLGYIAAQPFDIVRLNGKYYELLDYNRRGLYWVIEQVRVYDWLNDLDEFTGEPFEGPSSDDIRATVDPETGVQVYYNPNRKDDA